MQIVILGAAAGGGLPQWNCGCENCADARVGKIPVSTQSSVSVSADGKSWVVLNASPDIGSQLRRIPQLHPKFLRDTPIASVVLTNGDIDHIAGLLILREKTAFTVYATQSGQDILESNPVFEVLDRDLVNRKRLVLDAPFEPIPGLTVIPFAVPGKVALFLEREDPDLKAVGDQTIGLMLETARTRVAYVPGCADLPDWLLAKFADLDALLFDGTVWADDEMRLTGTGKKTGARMGHMAIDGPGGSLERLKGLNCRKIYVHINNTNPIWRPAGPERAKVEAAGWQVGYDGMEITL